MTAEAHVESENATPIAVLLLEPDQWRFRGMANALESAGGFKVIGEHDYAKILTMENAPDDLDPRASVVAQRLLTEFGISIIPHLKDLFPGIAVLIHGEHESLEATASIFAAGGSGFYALSSPPQYLPRAVSAIVGGRLWGPREAVALMAARVKEQSTCEAQTPLTDEERALLGFLNEGLANKEIAARLNLAEVTIKSRLGRLYKRFGVNTRLQLLSAALKQGVITSGTNGT